MLTQDQKRCDGVANLPNKKQPVMLSDAYGNSIGTQSSDAREAYDLGVHRFLGAEPGVSKAFEAAIKADEGFALAHIGLAREMQLAFSPTGSRRAWPVPAS